MYTSRREKKQRIDALARIPIFSTCTRSELARIDGLGTPLDVTAGRTLTREGEVGRECFVTLEGTAVAARAGRRVGAIGAGSIAGELALLDRTTRNATVVAGTPMQLLVFTEREFGRLLEIAPGISERVRRLAHERRLAVGAIDGTCAR
jgi:CRP-like cAMP-binding protein